MGNCLSKELAHAGSQGDQTFDVIDFIKNVYKTRLLAKKKLSKQWREGKIKKNKR